MPRQTAFALSGECADAVACQHKATLPPEEWHRTRAQIEAAAISAVFPGLPRAHLNAIWRARREFPEKRQQMRELLWARRWLRRR